MFILLYRSSRWTRSINAAMSAAVITLLETFFFMAIIGFVDNFRSETSLLGITKKLFILFYFSLGAINYYFMVICRHGFLFEHEFDGLKKAKKAFLIIACVVISLSMVTFFICVAQAHRAQVNSTRQP
jgi:hypothetical protein